MSISLHAVPASATGQLWEHDPTGDPQDEALFDAVFNCGVPLLKQLVLMARGYATGSPWAMLGKALTVAVCDAPEARVWTGVGTKSAPLNLIVAFTGPPGIGKGLTMAAPLIEGHMGINDWGGARQMPPPASGEILATYFYDATTDDEGKTIYVQHDDPIRLDWAEVDHLVAKASGKGSTIDSALRSLFSGETIGDMSLTRKKEGTPCTVEGGTYSAVVTVGAQPKRTAPILASGAGGLLQRFLWMWLADVGALDTHEKASARAELATLLGVSVPLTGAPTIRVHGPRGRITVDTAVLELMDEHRQQVLQQGGEFAESVAHQQNLHLRIATIYAGWRVAPGQPVHVDVAAWEWAAAVIEHSTRSLGQIKKELKGVKRQEATDKGEEWDTAKAAQQRAQEAREDSAADRAYPAMLMLFHSLAQRSQSGRVEHREIAMSTRGKQKSADRDYALKRGVDEGDIEVGFGERGGKSYALTMEARMRLGLL